MTNEEEGISYFGKVGNWIFCKTEFIDSDSQNELLGKEPEMAEDDFRFKLEEVFAYNPSKEGWTTIWIGCQRQTVHIPFKIFDKMFIDFIQG